MCKPLHMGATTQTLVLYKSSKLNHSRHVCSPFFVILRSHSIAEDPPQLKNLVLSSQALELQVSAYSSLPTRFMYSMLWGHERQSVAWLSEAYS